MENHHEFVIRPATVQDAALLNRWDELPHIKAATSNDGSKSFDANWDEELQPRSGEAEY